MGQRLVVHLVDRDKNGYVNNLAVVYFHWSAYTMAALDEAEKIVNLIEGREVKRPVLKGISGDNPHPELVDIPEITEGSSPDWRLRLIRGLEALGGGIYENDREFIQKMYPDETFSENHDRSSGLVAFSPEGIKDLCGWEEGSVYLCLDDRIAVSLVWTGPFKSYKDFVNNYDKYRTLPSEDKIPVWNYDMEDIPFDDLKDAEQALEKVCDTSWYFKDKTGRYFGVWA